MQRRLRAIAPRVVYAYRSIGDHLRDALLQKHIWTANPLQFNDPFDCSLPVNPTGSPQEAKEVINSLLRQNPMGEEFENRAMSAAEEGQVIQSDFMVSFLKRVIALTGAACFSETPNNILMWSHYAANHQGVCLGYEFGENRRDWLWKVDYSDLLPCVRLMDLVSEKRDDALKTLYLTKSKHWEYEREWRMLRVHPLFESDHDPERAFQIEPKFLRRVIFGCRIKPARREELISILSGWPTKIHFYQADCHVSRFALSFRRLKA